MATLGDFVDGDVLHAAELNAAGNAISFDPVWSGVTIGNGTTTGRYYQIQSVAFLVVTLEIGSTTTVTGPLKVDFPVGLEPVEYVRDSSIGQVFFEDDDGTDRYGFTIHSTTTAFEIVAADASATYLKPAALSSTIPFTWADGDRLVASLIYNTPAPAALSAYDTTALTLGSEVYAPVSRVTIVDDDEVMPTPTLWFDASDTSTITTDGSNGVTAWRPLTDTTGSGATDLVQATAADRPLSGTRTVNSLNVIDFDGSGDFLAITTPLIFTRPFTTFIVIQQDVLYTSTTTTLLIDGVDAATRVWIGFRQSAYRLGGTNLTTVDLGGTQTTTKPVLLNVEYNQYSSTDPATILGNILYVDGGFEVFNANTESWSAMKTGPNFNGVICEIVCYNRLLTDAEQYAVNDYLISKWGV